MTKKSLLSLLERKRFQRLRARIAENDAELGVIDDRLDVLEAVQEVTYGDTISEIKVAEVLIASANIVGVAAGDIAHTDGAELVASPGAGYALQLLSALLVYDFDTAAYTGGADTLVVRVGTIAATVAVAAADLITKASDAIVHVPILATDFSIAEDTNINLFIGTEVTQPGTAAGVIRAKVAYRVITTGL